MGTAPTPAPEGTPTAEEIKAAMPAKPVNDATPEQMKA